MADSHKNFATSLVATAPSPATSGTSLVVTAAQGTLFPAVPFNATIWPAGANPLTTNAEIVRVTAISTDTLTITRAQESSSARTVVVGDQIAATITAKTLEDIDPEITTYGILGSAILARPLIGGISSMTTNNQLFDNMVRFVVVELLKAATITGVKWWQGTAGAYTADGYNGWGLNTLSAGTMTLVASSTNDGNIWKATLNTVGTKAFSSTYAAAAGVYVISQLYCNSAETTAPTMGSHANSVTSAIEAFDFANSVKLYSTLSGQTALPSSQAFSGVAATSTHIAPFLY